MRSKPCRARDPLQKHPLSVWCRAPLIIFFCGALFVLSGCGSFVVNAVDSGTLKASDNSVSFGDVLVNTPTTQSITLTSTGAVPVTITGATLTGAGFTLPGGAFRVTLSPGQEETLNVEFDPTAVGTATGQLTIASNSSTAPTAVISLSGTGTPASSFASISIGAMPGRAISSTFMGLSHEWGTAQTMMGDSNTGIDNFYRQLLQNLMAYGSGRIVLRIGGNSTDMSGEPSSTTAQSFAELASALGVHFYLGVNLGSDNVNLAADQAKAYASQMPAGSLDAIEIGNEPDGYASNGMRPSSYTYQDYLVDFNTWKRNIMPLIPSGIKLMGASWASTGMLSNIQSYDSTEASALAIFSQHYYLANGSAANPDDISDIARSALVTAEKSLAQVQSELSALSDIITAKTQAFDAANLSVTSEQSAIETLKRKSEATKSAGKGGLFSAQNLSINKQLAEEEEDLSEATTKEASAKVDLDAATAKKTALQQALGTATQQEAEAEQGASEAQMAVNKAQSDVDVGQARVTQLQAGGAAPGSYTISAPEGGFGYTDLIDITIADNGYPQFQLTVIAAGGKNYTGDFKVADNCKKTLKTCQLAVGFHPSGTDAENVEVDLNAATAGGFPKLQITGKVSAAPDTTPRPVQGFFPLNHLPPAPAAIFKLDSRLVPLELELENDFGVMLDISTAFWSQAGSFSYLNQTQFFYNSNASSSNIKADVASMVFPGGTQLVLGTNISTGTSNSTPAGSTTTGSVSLLSPQAVGTTSTSPSLSSAQAAQAAINLVDGGNLLLRASWPLIWAAPKYKNVEFGNLVVARDGLDIPNFSGTNTVSSDVVNHFNLSNESYAQFDALPAQNGGDSLGSIFVDAKFGFDYVSSSFAKQAGFDNNWNKGFLAQVNGGLVFAGKLNLIASRSFGPSQTWTDSTTGVVTTQNNFRSWSVGVKYATNQSK